MRGESFKCLREAGAYRAAGTATLFSGPRSVEVDHGERVLRNAQPLAMSDSFVMADVRRAVPAVSDQTVRLVLRELKGEGLVKPSGVGRGTKWLRVDQ